MPPAMQAHANPTLNQRIRLRDQSAGRVVGIAGLVVKTESEKSSCSSALRRSTKERTSHFSSRLLLLNHTACSFPIAQDLHNAAWRCASRSQMGTKYFIYISAWSIMTATAMRGPPEAGAKFAAITSIARQLMLGSASLGSGTIRTHRRNLWLQTELESHHRRICPSPTCTRL
jgi:hypothetical protein